MTSPKKQYISNQRVAHIAAELERQSGDQSAVDRALQAAGLSRNDLNRENATVTSQDEARLLQAAVEIVADTSFATKAGLHFIKNTAVTVYVAKYSEDLRSAIENARKYSVIVDTNLNYFLRTSSNSVSFVIAFSDPFLRQDPRLMEFLTFSILSVMRYVTGREFYPLEIRFNHSAPKEHEVIQRLAGCPVMFDAEETEILLAPSTLNLSIPTYDPSLLRYLEGYGNSLLSKINKPVPDLRAQVEDLLVSNLPGRLLPAGEVASSLGMGRRTLARKLARKGISFSSIADDLRCKLANSYLIQSETPIAEIAFLLDFSDQASFTSAFKRWTKETPKVFRTRHVAV